MSTALASLVRHLLTGVAGWLALEYQIDRETLDIAAGGLAAAVAIGWSLWEKRK